MFVDDDGCTSAPAPTPDAKTPDLEAAHTESATEMRAESTPHSCSRFVTSVMLRLGGHRRERFSARVVELRSVVRFFSQRGAVMGEVERALQCRE